MGADPTEVPAAMRTKIPPTVRVFDVGLRVNVDADAYVETLQAVVVEARIFIIISHQTYGRLLTHQTLILCIITCGVWLKRKLISITITSHPPLRWKQWYKQWRTSIERT
ncbi:hypothetical protein ACTXT7_012499 [Hymenolepis weldensis]